jgi:hypothetical protein
MSYCEYDFFLKNYCEYDYHIVQLKSKGNETTQTEFDARSHLQLVESVAGKEIRFGKTSLKRKAFRRKTKYTSTKYCSQHQ